MTPAIEGKARHAGDYAIILLSMLAFGLFYAFYQRLQDQGCERMEAFVKAYRLYTEQIDIDAAEPVLGLTRAWTLIRFFESDLLQLTPCTRCHGNFVAHAHSPSHDYVCGICQPPSRAGKTRRRQAQKDEAAKAAETPAIAGPVKHLA